MLQLISNDVDELASALSFLYVIGLNYSQRLRDMHDSTLSAASTALGNRDYHVLQMCFSKDIILSLLVQCRSLINGIKRRIISAVADGEVKTSSSESSDEISTSIQLDIGQSVPTSGRSSSELSLILFSIDRASSVLQ
jgi:hypothetical protein